MSALKYWDTNTGTWVTVTGGGGGGTPGGSTTQFQYNNAGAFGGVPLFTYDGTTTSLDLSAALSTRLRIKPYLGTPECNIQCGNSWLLFMQNIYFDGTNYRYVADGVGLLMGLTAAGFYVYNVPTGLAGAIATPALSFRANVVGKIVVASGGDSDSWDTAYSLRSQWNGGATGLVATTGRTSLGATTFGSAVFTLPDSANVGYLRHTAANGAIADTYATVLTNIGATDASVVPNTVPNSGDILVGSTTNSKYLRRQLYGAVGLGTFSVGELGGVTIDGISNAALTNSSIQIGNTGAPTPTALGGTASLDAITGMSTIGIVKRSAANTFVAAVPGTDYPAAANYCRQFTTGTGATYTPAANIRAIFVELQGGGGGGGGAKATASNCAPAGGGGGGGYSTLMITSVAASYTYTVGQGGAGGTAVGGTTGTAGGATTFTGVTQGGGGGGGNGDATGGTSNIFANAGGAGGSGNIHVGSDGGHGYRISGTAGRSGDGGSSHYGGLSTGHITAIAGAAGAICGGGGGGGLSFSATGQAGGAGADGIIRIWEFY